ncbi:MAG TPA: hypothetical protein VFQ50_06835 [Flavobacterium sp.]|nr:hypothetical protein [Flavobacterium sp.]
MKTRFLNIILLFVATSGIAQIKWQPGYFIDNTGTRTECLIYNRDWNDNPVQFEYKISEGADEAKRGLKDTREFGVNGESVYVRAEVDMDRASNKVGTYPSEKDPVFVRETFFLKVLVQGTNTLFVVNKSGLEKFFFKTPKKDITQLVYIKYRQFINFTKGYEEKTKENNLFRNQLWNDVKCQQTELRKVERIKYEERDLVNHFKEVNACAGDTTISTKGFEAPRKKGNFNVKVGIGYNMFHHTITREVARNSSDISKSSPGFGVELEYILPTNKNKWAVVLEANYNTFEGSQVLPSSTLNGAEVAVKQNFLQVPVGLRHFMFVTDEAKIMLTGVIAANFVNDAFVEYRNGSTLEPSSYVYNFGVGIGFEYKRFSIEARLYTPMSIVKNVDSQFNKTAFTLRYRVL